SATDTEAVAHLVAEGLKRFPATEGESDHSRYVAAVRWAIGQLQGTYGLAILFPDQPDLLIAARFGSPLVIGVGRNEYFLGSDASPLAGHTDQIVYLADHQIALLTRCGFTVHHRDQGVVSPHIETVDLDAAATSLNGFDHYMLKEIYEQPDSLRNAMRGRLNDEDATAIF